MKLELQNIMAGYESDVVLKNLSLSVREGEFLSLLGASGCGKTTLMKSIAGILPLSSGRIFLDGQDITHVPVHKRGTTVMFQDMRLFPHKTVAENVAFPLKMQGVPRKERMQRAQALLEKVQLAGFGSRKPGELSGGQQQRVSLARALAAQPKLLLLDEPFSALDENLREDMRQLVLQLKEEFSMTVILVTHDRQEALSMSDRIALLFDGQLVQTGTPREVYTRPATRQAADYFGDCVYLRGQVIQGEFAGPGVWCRAEVADGWYSLLLRPDNLHLDEAGDYRLTVEAVHYRGGDTLVSFRGEGDTGWKKALTGPVSWQPGEKVNARVEIQRPILFQEEIFI